MGRRINFILMLLTVFVVGLRATDCPSTCSKYESEQQDTKKMLRKLERAFGDRVSFLESRYDLLLRRAKRHTNRIEELEAKIYEIENMSRGNTNSTRSKTREWSEWSEYTPCSVSCGIGNKKRYRTCIGPEDGANNCKGIMKVQLPCKIKCPADGSIIEGRENLKDWGEWSDWSPCENVYCPTLTEKENGDKGYGMQTRNRKCNIEKCPGRSFDSRKCKADCQENTDSE